VFIELVIKNPLRAVLCISIFPRVPQLDFSNLPVIPYKV